MRHRVWLGVLLLLPLGLVGCAGTKSVKEIQQVNKVAVVSFALNDWGDFSSVKFSNGDSASGGIGTSRESQRKTIQKATDQLLTYTEESLGRVWQVKRTSTFAGEKAYRQLTVEKTLDAYVPVVNSRPLGVFTQNSMGMKKARLTSEQARALCSALGVDAVFVAFSEWTTVTGTQVPITRPLTKNVFSLWDKSGKELFARRIDRRGTLVIGGMGQKVSISIPKVVEEYKDTYKQALQLALK